MKLNYEVPTLIYINARSQNNKTIIEYLLFIFQVLRCDRRVFRTSPLLEVILYIIKACLAASRTHLAKHIQDNPILERTTPNNQVSNDAEREELKNALVATQVHYIIINLVGFIFINCARIS